MICVKNLYRYYGKKSEKTAVNNLSFSVHQGEIFGLLGPNGAGKTTTIKVLTTLLLPSSGKVHIDGLDVIKDRRKILAKINLISGGERSLYWRLTAKENLEYFGCLYYVNRKTLANRIERLLDLVGLKEQKDQKVETFSKGMKQRLQIARGLINDPSVIFMDEPTIGLDPSASLILHNVILDLKANGKTIILTTHYMNEAEKLCDRIAFIHQGKMIAVGTPEFHKKDNGMQSLEDVYLKHFNKTVEVKL